MSAATWRVVCEGGEVRSVAVRHTPGSYGGEWRADSGGEAAGGSSARKAVLILAAELDWPVAEIVAPGETTAAERLAQVTADRDYWREQAIGMAPSVDGMRAITSLLIPGGTGCVVDPERAVAAVRGVCERADAAEAECARLREAMRRQSAAVRLASTARATIDAHDQATLRSLRGQDRAALIEELAAARREGDDWNARATALESERDEARAETDALRAQLAEARAIVEGRTVAPADAERAAHSGEWLVRYRDSRAVRWWPLDSTGRPCAWPTGGGL